MKEAIRKRASELGFDGCRFTTAAPPEHAAEFQHWVGAGQHGEMAYLERNAPKRIDPQKVLPGAKTVIALATSYYQGAAGSVASGTQRERGRIARYARYADYHDVLGARLDELSAEINALGGPGTRSLGYVDTGPILERDLAQRAGIGFIGKHTNLISRNLGNWIFLSEVLTTLGVAPDAEEENRCGSCSRCLSACPTGAITAPFKLDARKCISYLTIELKGPIPVELRPALGDRIYGCDDCLDACPWNRFARAGELMREHARADLDQPGLVELLGLDETGFKARFHGTPIFRTKRRGFLRNVCVALGNIGDGSALPALRRAAGDREPLIAEHAQWAIAEIDRRHRGTEPPDPHSPG